MRKIILTEEDKHYFCCIAGDLQSGNHLLRPRSDEYWEYWDELAYIYTGLKTLLSERDIEIILYMASCEDPKAKERYNKIMKTLE